MSKKIQFDDIAIVKALSKGGSAKVGKWRVSGHLAHQPKIGPATVCLMFATIEPIPATGGVKLMEKQHAWSDRVRSNEDIPDAAYNASLWATLHAFSEEIIAWIKNDGDAWLQAAEGEET